MTKKHWGKIKSEIKDYSSSQFLEIVSDLYNLSGQNKNFLEARFLTSTIDAIEPYKKIIDRALFPDVIRGQDVSLTNGKKAISDYKKSTKDVFGTMELMMFYVECGHKFTSEYGDMDESFYNSFISVFDNIIKLIKKHPDHKNAFYNRIKTIANDSRNFGWGYDEVYDIFIEANL
ncbi:MAG: hypothetical protein ACI9IL_001083 [Rickettsiales bacterium]|jgi:hypothetical protein